tara:strand:- start:589 stop:807 length:219 start_codon:yes stop_codon:yes gene_type:complete
MIDIDITRTCPITGVTATKVLKVNPDKWRAYNRNELNIQDALPHLSPDDREFIISGISEAGWLKIFPIDADE